MTERERLPDNGAAERRQSLLRRRPEEIPIFPELAPKVQDYLKAEYQAHWGELPREQKKQYAEQAQTLAREIFVRGERGERMREDITRYGEYVAHELGELER